MNLIKLQFSYLKYLCWYTHTHYLYTIHCMMLFFLTGLCYLFTCSEDIRKSRRRMYSSFSNLSSTCTYELLHYYMCCILHDKMLKNILEPVTISVKSNYWTNVQDAPWHTANCFRAFSYCHSKLLCYCVHTAILHALHRALKHMLSTNTAL